MFGFNNLFSLYLKNVYSVSPYNTVPPDRLGYRSGSRREGGIGVCTWHSFLHFRPSDIWYFFTFCINLFQGARESGTWDLSALTAYQMKFIPRCLSRKEKSRIVDSTQHTQKITPRTHVETTNNTMCDNFEDILFYKYNQWRLLPYIFSWNCFFMYSSSAEWVKIS